MGVLRLGRPRGKHGRVDGGRLLLVEVVVSQRLLAGDAHLWVVCEEPVERGRVGEVRSIAN